MVSRVRLLVLLALALDGGCLAAQQRSAMSAEDILAVRQVDGDVQLSPDGKSVAVTITEPADPSHPQAKGRSNIWIVATDPAVPLRRLQGSAGADDTPRWSPDGRSIAFLSARRSPHDGSTSGEQLFVAPLDGGPVRQLVVAPSGVDQFAWARDGETIAFIARDAHPTHRGQDEARQETVLASGADPIESVATTSGPTAAAPRVYCVTVADGRLAPVTHGERDVQELAWSPDGRQLALIVARAPAPGHASALSLEIVDRWTGAVARTLSDSVAGIGGALRWSPDGRWITFLRNSASGWASWLAVVPPSGGPTHGVLQEDTGTVWRAEWMPSPDRLMVEEVRGTSVVLRTVDVGTGATVDWAPVTTSQDNFGFSTNGRSAAFVSETPRSAADVWLVARGESPRRLTTLNPGLASRRLGNVAPFDWTSSEDGSTVHGLIVTPPDFVPGRAYPTVVETHPGDLPWWPGWEASWWAWGQLLASHGYAVFLPNYRGVTGQGWRSHEHLAEWGGLSYRDLIDGIDALVRRGIADSTRLGIGGWSNGGFMTEWAITHTTRFKAAVAKSAHADFASLYATSPSSRSDLLLDFGGSPYDHRSVYDAHSPITYVRHCRTPTLLVYGEHDVVSPSQGEEFYTALEEQHVPTDLVVYPREGHGLSEYGHRLDFQRRVLAWFDRYLK